MCNYNQSKYNLPVNYMRR